MLSLLLISILALGEPTSNVELSISSGIESVLPDRFIPIGHLKELEAEKSYWVKVQPNIEFSGKYILRGGNSYMQNIRFYNQDMKLLKTGNSIMINKSATYYLFYPFYDYKDTGFFSVTLLEQIDRIKSTRKREVVQLIFFSIVGFVLLITIVFFFGRDNLVYRNYAYYLCGIFVFFSYQYGYLGAISPVVNQLNPIWVWISSAFLSHGYLLFSRSFLDMKEKDIAGYNFSKYCEYFIFGVVLAEVISVLFESDAMHQIWFRAIVIVLQIGFMVGYLYRIARMRTLLSNLVLLGSLVLLLSSLTGQFSSAFGSTNETNLFIQAGLILDVFILSVGIAVRVDLIQKSRQEVQSALINQLKINEKLQQEYTKELETKVKERTLDLNKRNTENETLLREVHHRVKNNLQMITSLLNMQQRRLQSAPAKEALTLTKSRVKSIGLIHEHLYQFDDFSSIRLDTYVEALVNMLVRKDPNFKADIDVPNRQADIETAMPIGLILNELITNSLKYGLDTSGALHLRIAIWEENNTLLICVSDKGQGFDSKKVRTGFGHTIIQTLLESCEGVMDTESDTTGFHVTISIKDYTFV